MITGIAHINLTVPVGTLSEAEAFYSATLGFRRSTVPKAQRHTLAWFDIGDSGQQVHIAFGPPNDPKASRHPCFKVGSPETLLELQGKVHKHHEAGGAGAPIAADKPGEMNSGSQGVEYPKRFFARDYAGNRLEFSC